MAENGLYAFDKDSSKRIVNATRIVEELFDNQFKTPDDYSVVYAKIVQNFGDGTYEAVQVVYDEDTATWEDISYGLEWAADSDQTNPLVEANSSTTVAVDTVVIAILGGSTSGSVWTFIAPDGATSDAPPHPFKVTFVGGDVWEIGADRGEAFRLVRDLITIYDRDASLLYTIEKTVGEQLGCGANQYIYYVINRTAAGTWSATATWSAVWPPVASDTDQDAIYYPIARTATGGGVGQLQFSDISIYTRPLQPSFAAFRHTTGATILAGTVRDGQGVETVVAGATVNIGDEAWVEVVTQVDAIPTVNINVQTGAYPGWQTEVAGVLTRNYLLGKWTLDVWTPTHEGDLFIGTQYQPDIHADAQAADAQSYRVMASNDVASVGADKSLFFDGRKLDINVLGGEFEDINDSGELKLGGVTADIDLNIITGASILGQVLTLTTTDRTLVTEKGLVQEFSDAAGTPIAITIPTPTPSGTLAEGPGIDITEAPANTFTISSLLQGSTSIDVTLGVAGAAHTVDTIEQLSITTDANGLKLVGDANIGAGSWYYGNSNGGAKGFHDLQAEIVLLLSAYLDCGDGIGFDIDSTGLITINCQVRPSTNELGQKNTPLTSVLVDDGGTCDTWIEFSVDHGKSIVNVSNSLELDGDVETPGYYQVYGYDDTDKGWKDLGSMFLDTNSTTVTHTGSGVTIDVEVGMSIDIDSNGLHLEGDEDTPGNNHFYGTNGSGTKGWNELTSVTNIVDIQLTAGNILQIKTQQSYVWDPASASAWTNVTGWQVSSCSP